MSVGFRFAGRVNWGTNGAIETYLESLSQVAADRLGPEDRLAAAFREQRDGFYMGAVIDLDDILIGPGDRGRFVALLDEATDRLLREKVLTEYGRDRDPGAAGPARGGRSVGDRCLTMR